MSQSDNLNRKGYVIRREPSGDVKIFFRLKGVLNSKSQCPIVMIGGLGTDSLIWREQQTQLSKNHPVITIDLRGTGRSDKPIGSPYNYQMFADDIKAVLEQLGILVITYIGAELGASVGLYFTAVYPQYVERLILSNPNLKYTIQPIQPIQPIQSIQPKVSKPVDHVDHADNADNSETSSNKSIHILEDSADSSSTYNSDSWAFPLFTTSELAELWNHMQMNYVAFANFFAKSFIFTDGCFNLAPLIKYSEDIMLATPVATCLQIFGFNNPNSFIYESLEDVLTKIPDIPILLLTGSESVEMSRGSVGYIFTRLVKLNPIIYEFPGRSGYANATDVFRYTTVVSNFINWNYQPDNGDVCIISP